MKNITGILRGLAAPALIACLSATVSLCTGAAARADEALEATVGYYPGALISLPALVAKDQNFFEKDGLKVELVPITTGPAMTCATPSTTANCGASSVGGRASLSAPVSPRRCAGISTIAAGGSPLETASIAARDWAETGR